MIQKSGRAAAALDIEYFHPDPEHPHRSNHFDILTSSGFLCLGNDLDLCLWYMHACNNIVFGDAAPMKDDEPPNARLSSFSPS